MAIAKELSAAPASRFAWLRLSHAHTAFSATLVIMASTLLSGLLGLVRTAYINARFGAGPATDAYNAAFQLPDMLSYFLVGGVASISLITILNRFREKGDEAGAEHALLIVLNGVAIVFGLAIVVAEIFAPFYTQIAFRKFPPESAALCTHLTRIILPAQLFFFAAGVLGSRLLVRKIFLYQAFGPLVYNAGILLGGVLLSRYVGIDSLAYGVLAGMVLGPAGFAAFGAYRNGWRYRFVFSLKHPVFHEWLKLSLPLMMGVSLTYADKWILGYYSSAVPGGLSRLTVAKNLFNQPMSLLGSAAGAASLPFFSSLFAQGRAWDFAMSVNRSISRVIATALLAGAWMVALSFPIVDLFRAGSFKHSDAVETSQYFTIFSVSIAVWTAQAIYSRSFYAAGNTLVPAVAGWVVTLVSIPIYALFFNRMGVVGLAVASDLGMLLSTATLAVLLHRYRLVHIQGLEFGELGKALLTAPISCGATIWVVGLVGAPRGHRGDIVSLVVGTMVWAGTCFGLLALMGSKLPRQLLRRA